MPDDAHPAGPIHPLRQGGGPDPGPALRRAVAALAAGRPVVVTDDADREDEGDLVLAADAVTADQVAFVVRHTTGILCAPMPGERADALGLPPMVADNADPHGTAFTVTVDHVDAGTGVAAADRARTLRALADPGTRPGSLRRPGHVFGLRARDGGVLARPGHTEATVDLLRLAGRTPVGVIGEIVAEDGSMARGPGLRAFAAAHDLPVLAIADLVRYHRAVQRATDPGAGVGGVAGVAAVASARMPTAAGDFEAVAYRGADGTEHLALVLGDLAAARSGPGVLARVHSECLTGDVVGSLRCDCGTQLEQALRAIAAEGAGVLVYLRGHEGRGIGLANKIRAYGLQEGGLDTVDANTAQGLPVDARDYADGAAVLADLGATRVRLLTHNPGKCAALAAHGIEILARVPLPGAAGPHNLRYLRTKQERLGHELGLGQDAG